jgi:hypothetical protein
MRERDGEPDAPDPASGSLIPSLESEELPTRDELIAHVRALNQELAEQRQARDEGAWIEASLKKRTRLLNERMKELACMLSIVQVIRRALSYRDKVRVIVAALPGAWQHASSCRARIILGGEIFETPGFLMTPWGMREPVWSRGREVGCVEVSYLSRRPDADHGPFLREERMLLASVAECLGIVYDRG